MLNCWRLRGTLAAAVYGETTPDEQERLDTHLDACPRCQARYVALRQLHDAIPVSSAALDRDLAPVIMQSVAETRRRRHIRHSGFAWAGMATAAAAIMVVAIPYVRDQRESAPAPAHPAVVALTPVEQAMGQANEMADRHDFATAYRTLAQAVNAHPGDPAAAEAKSRSADMAFSELHWYSEARDDYEQLAKQFPARFRDDPNAIARRDLLAEAGAQDYASLYALDAAHRHATDTFAQLEQVITRYPGTFVASLAARDMADLSTETGAVPDRANAFAAARNRCKDPVARAQLSMELGHVYLKDLKEPDKATEQYRQAAASPNTTLAKLAEECLSRVSVSQ